MKILITYSSRTGNTRRVVEAVADALSGEITTAAVESAPPAEGYDWLIHGFWVNGATADDFSLEYLKGLKHQKVGLIGTMGANPQSSYGRSIALRLKNILKANNNELCGWFLCAGEIDTELIRWMETLPEEHSQYPTPERRQNWQDAKGHPDREDLNAAVTAFVSESLSKV